MIKYLINLGVKPETNDADRRMMQLHNQLLLIICLVASLRLFKDLFFDFFPYGIVIGMSIFCQNAFCLYLTHKGKFITAKLLNIGGFLPIVVVLKVLFGSAVGVDFVVMIAMTLVLFFHRDKLERTVIFLSYGICFSLATWWVAANGVMIVNEEITSDFYYYFFLGGMLVMLLVLNAFVQEREAYQKHTEKLLGTLKKNDQLLKRQKQALEQANSDLEKFVYMASHDLKSPLRNIESFVGLIHRKTQKLQDADLDQYMEFVKKGTQNMQSLIAGILDYSKIVQPKNEWTYLDDVLEEVQQNLQNVIAEKQAKLEIEALPRIYADHAQMVMLFQNLIQNGIKYNAQQTPGIQIRCHYTPTAFHVHLQDNGIGISAEHHQKIFDMFSRLHSAGEYAGTGIGLATCKRIMEKTKGKITLKSTPNQGSTFILQWPLEKVQKNTSPAKRELATT